MTKTKKILYSILAVSLFVNTPLVFADIDFVGVDIFCSDKTLLAFTNLVPFLEICPISGPVLDSDGDGLLDDEEINIHGTDPLTPNTVANVALILVEPDGTPNHAITHDLSYFQEIADELKRYYKEASYEDLVLLIEIFDKNGNWFPVPQTLDHYAMEPTQDDNPLRADDINFDEFIQDSIDSADSVVNFNKYDYDPEDGIGTIVLIPASFGSSVNGLGDDFGPLYCCNSGPDGTFNTADGVNVDASVVPDWRFRDTQQDIRGIVHEVGHALGKVLVTSIEGDKAGQWSLPHTIADGDWSLMGGITMPNPPRDPILHPVSFSKEWLNWLNYREVFDGSHTVNSLPTMEFDDDVLIVHDTISGFEDNFFIMEARTTDPQYSNYDNGVPNDAFLLYYVDVQLSPEETVAIEEIEDISDPASLPITFCEYSSDKSFRIDNVVDAEKYEVEIELTPLIFSNCDFTNLVTAVLFTGKDVWSAISSFFDREVEEGVVPDLDLHAYSKDGRHVGINYLTSEYENQILGAFTSGDLNNVREWITIPFDVDVSFVVTSKDTLNFLSDNQQASDLTDGIDSYSLLTILNDAEGDRHFSPELSQQIQPGLSLAFQPVITVNPDGSFDLSTKTDPVTELTLLQEFINRLPDSAFDKNPAPRMNALSNKINAVINEVQEGEHEDAIEKLTDDIRRKMDGITTPEDWIVDLQAQNVLTTWIDRIINNIEELDIDDKDNN